MFPAAHDSKAFNLDFLLTDFNPGPRSRYRPPRGACEVDTQNLVMWLGDPYDAIGAAVLINSIRDLRKGRDTRDVIRFLVSDWCEEILLSLDLDAAKFRWLARQVQLKPDEASRIGEDIADESQNDHAFEDAIVGTLSA
jgi:hypothetical protein